MKSDFQYLLKSADINDFSKAQYKCEYALLDNKKREEVSKKPPLKAKQTVAARILLREMIFERYGITEYEIGYNQNGKPLLPFCNFSISHTGSKVFCVVSDKPIGLDAETEKTVKKSEHYPLLTKNETAVINSAPQPSNAFLEIWTRKEAYVKLKGLRLSAASETDTTAIADKSFETYKENGLILTLCY